MTVTCRLHEAELRPSTSLRHGWRRGEEEGFNQHAVHAPQLAEAQTDLATVRDAMEATDEALARKEQEAAYMVDGEM